jgi:hypothetical protein
MKRIVFLIISLIITNFTNGFTQNPNYLKAMEGIVGEIESTQFGTSLQPLANKMERIATTEKTEWLPNYWVAYCYLIDSYAEQDAAKKDLLLDKADSFIETAEKLSKNNDEIEMMKANLASSRMAVNPQDRWQKYGGAVQKAMGVAMKLNSENPRIALMQAQSLFYTPEAYGGGKDKAKPVLEKTIELFSKFKPASTIHPNWGLATAKWMLSQI